MTASRPGPGPRRRTAGTPGGARAGAAPGRGAGRPRNPAGTRRGTSSGGGQPGGAPARWAGGLTGRAAVLALVLGVLALSLAFPLQRYVAQRGQIRALQAQTQAEEARVRQLEAEQARWQDPAYVAAQARQRLHFVLPGETGYVVLDPPVPERAPVPGEPVLPARSTPRPWYATVWGSLAAAAGR